MIRVHIDLPDARRSITGQQLDATAEPDGYVVEAWCWGWGRSADGSVRLDVRATVVSPPGVLEPIELPGRGDR